MRKFLLPIINVVNLILVSIAWGLSPKTAIIDAGRSDRACGNIYQVIWEGSKANTLGIIGFFLFILACAITLFVFLPVKFRKYCTCVGGLMYIAGGIMLLNSPWSYCATIVEIECTSSLIAMVSLIIIAGAFTLAMSLLEFFGKKEAK